MKQKVLKNVWLRICMIAAVMTTAFAGTAGATEEVYKTALFGRAYSSAEVGNYTTTWTSTYNGFALSISNLKNHGSSGWYSYLATGQNSTARVGTITTVDPIDVAITRVAVMFDALHAANVNSITLYISENGSTWNPVNDFAKVKGEVSVSIPASLQAANLYYRIEVDCAAGNTGSDPINKDNFVKISKIEYFHENLALVEAPVITGQQVFAANSSTTVSIACPEPDADATIEYSTDNGYNWHPYSAPFSLSETTTVIARANKTGMQENQASKVFTLATDATHFTWNLTAAPNGTVSTTTVTWTDEDATMTLDKGESSTNANYYLGGTNSNTAFYKNQILTIAPNTDYTIISVKITTSTASDVTAGFSRAWENATQSVVDNVITVTPEIGTEPISIGIANETHILGVEVDCSPASSPYVTATGEQTVISGTSTGTFDVYYNRLESTSAVVTLCDADGDAATYDWIQVGLDENKDITFSVTQKNPNTTERTAYAILSVEKDGDHYFTPVIAVTQEAPIKVTISSVGYSTLYYGSRNLEVPAGVTAYTYTVGTKLEVSQAYSEGAIIPARTGVVLKGNAADHYFYETNDEGTRDGNNKLRGSDAEEVTSGGTYYYALTLDKDSNPNSVGFYWMNETGTTFTNGAHKAYLALDKKFSDFANGTSGNVKGYVALPGEDDPTAIENVNVNVDLDGAIYNIAGQRMNKMQKGINIVNGKKILK